MKSFLGKTLVLFKKGISLLLFLLFTAFFGIPSIKEYLKNETIFIGSQSHYSKDDFPVVTIKRAHDNIDNMKGDCYSRNDSSDLMECVRNYTFDLNDTIMDMRQNVYMGANSSVNKSNWKMGYSNSYSGRTYTISDGFELSYSDYLQISLPRDGRYAIDFHDKNHYIEASEQFEDFQRPAIYLDKGNILFMHLKVEKVVLLPEVSNCNDNKDYSFLNCVKVNMSFIHYKYYIF